MPHRSAQDFIMSVINRTPVMFYSFLLWHPFVILGFNLDTKSVNVIYGPVGSLFGFSASFLPVVPDSDTLGMLVGAPNTTTNEGGLSSGSLFLCENVLDPTETCSIQRRMDDNLPMVAGTVNEEFGSALVMTRSGKFMVCSPNWKDTQVVHFTFVVGRCTYTDLEEQDNQQIMPFYHVGGNKQTYYITPVEGKKEYNHGVASFGFSVDSDKSSIFVFGAPGVLMSEGTVTITNMNTKQTSTATSRLVNKLNTTAYGYQGYSVKIAKICDGSDVCFAASAPNRNRVGMVLIYRWMNGTDLTLIQIFEERQAWSYFGYALCAVDTDGDGYDELLVGAPHYTDMGEGQNGYDQGHIFIYSRSKINEKLQQKAYLDGAREKFARFGTAIQHIGDINLDKYKDVAVGAPGESDGAGCIYIYLGGPTGLVNSPSQRITAKQVSNGLPKPVKGFGFAFSDHAKPDSQEYPVFAATSVVSDAIIVFKSRPIVDVEATLTADPNPVAMEQACAENGVPGVCFKINLCMKYTLRGGGNTPLTFQISLDMDVQVRPILKRALLRLSDNNFVESISDYKKQMNVSDKSHCTKFVAVLRENQVNQDRFTPVQIIANYALVENTSLGVHPVLDAMKPNNVSLTVTFVNKCGDNNICEVDLSVIGSLNYQHTGEWRSIVINSTKELQVNVAVKNSQETSYWTVIKIKVDAPLRFSRYASDVRINCQPERLVSDVANAASNTVSLGQDTTMVVCNYYGPLDQFATFGLSVVFDTEQIELTKNSLIITAEALPQNINSLEVSSEDNTDTLTTDVEIIADVSINGSSSPTEITIYEAKRISLKDTAEKNKFRKTGNEVKPHNVTHKILVRNNGPSFLPNTTISVSVPIYLVDGTELINEADVKIATADGRVTECHGIIKFESLHQTTASTPSYTSQTDRTTDADSSSEEETTYFTDSTPLTSEETTCFGGFDPVKRRKKRATDEEENNEDAVYTLDCDTAEDICQVFVCKIETFIPSGGYAEINVSLVIDKANIPLPENYKTFQYSIKSQVNEPTHLLFKTWSRERIVKTITKFPVLQQGEKINIWIIIGCVIAGLVLITIIVLIFWKLGFFKRAKHQEVAQWKRESQRRSRKGYSKAPSDDAGEGESAPTAAETKPDAI